MIFAQITAIAKLTLRENLRSKVFWVLLLSGIAVNSTAVLLPVVGDATDQITFLESMSLRSIAFFGMLIGAILSATSIPKDIDEKSIFSIITKPVSRLNMVFGKVLGFIYITGITTVVLGCFSIAFIRTAAYNFSTKEAAIQTTEDNKNEKITIVSGGGTSYHILSARKQVKKVDFEVIEEYRKSGAGLWWLQGGKGTAIWTIPLKKYLQNKDIEIEMEPNIEADKTATPIEIKISNPALQYEERRSINAELGKKLTLRLSNKIIKNGDQLIIELSVKRPEDFVSIMNNKVKVFYDSVNFEYNFIKAILIILFQIILIIFIGVTGSTFLITPAVSITFVMFMFFSGYMVDYLKDFESVINFGGVHDHSHHLHELTNEKESVSEPPKAMLNFLDVVLKYMFAFLTYAIPNLDNFNIESFITNRIDIPIKKVASLFYYSFAYIVSFALISSIIIKKKEI